MTDHAPTGSTIDHATDPTAVTPAAAAALHCAGIGAAASGETSSNGAILDAKAAGEVSPGSRQQDAAAAAAQQRPTVPSEALPRSSQASSNEWQTASKQAAHAGIASPQTWHQVCQPLQASGSCDDMQDLKQQPAGAPIQSLQSFSSSALNQPGPSTPLSAPTHPVNPPMASTPHPAIALPPVSPRPANMYSDPPHHVTQPSASSQPRHDSMHTPSILPSHQSILSPCSLPSSVLSSELSIKPCPASGGSGMPAESIDGRHASQQLMLDTAMAHDGPVLADRETAVAEYTPAVVENMPAVASDKSAVAEQAAGIKHVRAQLWQVHSTGFWGGSLC